MARKYRYVALLAGWLALSASADERFPQPAELDRDVDFWVSIFADYSTTEGVLHDNRNLAIVYERIDMPAGLSRRERQRRVGDQRKQLQAVLRKLAGGKRDGLSAEEARVLALWPEDVSNATLAAAVNQIRFQQGLSDRFRAGLARSGRWRDFIEEEFTALGVPVELAALPHVESSYNPNARSHVGASGIWQFTRSTGRRFMQVDHVLDERNDPFEATRGAGKLLAYNYSITGNWPMAITAYNHGLSGARRAMRQFGDESYVDILRKYKSRTFGFASRNFYVAFLAAKQVDQNPDKYFPGVAAENPTRYAETTLAGYVAAADLSKALGVSTKQLARHNPALQATVWQGSKHVPRGFSVRMPASMLDAPIDELMAKVPEASWYAKQLPDLYHTISRGDTLSQIADEYDTTVSTLVALNSLNSRHRIRAGQRLRLPAAGPAPLRSAPVSDAVVASSDAPASPATTAAQPDVAVASLAPEAAADVSSAPSPSVDTETVVASLAEDLPVGEQVEEMTPAALAGDLASTLVGTLQTALLSDPSDYGVADDGTIEVQPLETLGHYADWLGIRTQRLRDANGFAFRRQVGVGERLRLVFDDVDAAAFESRRIAYHRAEQDQYFRAHVITGITEHEVRRGESIWILSLREYGVPIWLFRQYNPDVDLHRVQPGTTIRFPVLVDSERS